MSKRYDRELTPEELAAMPDADIDYSDIPEAGEEFWRNAELRMPDSSPKTAISVRLDSDMLEWFKAQGRGYQTRINAVLRSFYEAHRN